MNKTRMNRLENKLNPHRVQLIIFQDEGAPEATEEQLARAVAEARGKGQTLAFLDLTEGEEGDTPDGDCA